MGVSPWKLGIHIDLTVCNICHSFVSCQDILLAVFLIQTGLKFTWGSLLHHAENACVLVSFR